MTTCPRLEAVRTPPDIHIHQGGVIKLLKDIKHHKAAGPDNIPARILKDLASHLAPSLTIVFQASIQHGAVPDDWKISRRHSTKCSIVASSPNWITTGSEGKHSSGSATSSATESSASSWADNHHHWHRCPQVYFKEPSWDPSYSYYSLTTYRTMSTTRMCACLQTIASFIAV